MCVEVCIIVPQPGVIFRRFNESKHNVYNGTVLIHMLWGFNELREKLFIQYEAAENGRYCKAHPHLLIDQCRLIY